MKFDTKQMQAAIGDIPLSGAFVKDVLGIAPAETDKRAMFWHPEQLVSIIDKLINRLHDQKMAIEFGDVTPAAKAPKAAKTAPAPAPSSAAAAFDEDDEEL